MDISRPRFVVLIVIIHVLVGAFFLYGVYSVSINSRMANPSRDWNPAEEARQYFILYSAYSVTYFVLSEELWFGRSQWRLGRIARSNAMILSVAGIIFGIYALSSTINVFLQGYLSNFDLSNESYPAIITIVFNITILYGLRRSDVRAFYLRQEPSQEDLPHLSVPLTSNPAFYVEVPEQQLTLLRSL